MRQLNEAEMIQEIITAVNAHAEQTKNYPKPGKKADADLFFSLAFCDESTLRKICTESGIKTVIN